RSPGKRSGAVNQSELLGIALADFIRRPLPDRPVEIIAQGIDYRTGTVPRAILALGLTPGRPAGPIMHDGEVIVIGGGDDPVCFGDPVVIDFTPRFDVLVMNRDVPIAVPALVFMVKAESVTQ